MTESIIVQGVKVSEWVVRCRYRQRRGLGADGFPIIEVLEVIHSFANRKDWAEKFYEDVISCVNLDGRWLEERPRAITAFDLTGITKPNEQA